MCVSFDGCLVVTYSTRRQAHIADAGEIDKSVRLVRVIPSLGMFLSCANTSEKSFVLRLVDKSSGGSEFNVPKVNTFANPMPGSASQGVSVFDYSEVLNLIVTGGIDCHVRIWNPYVQTHPTAVFKGRTFMLDKGADARQGTRHRCRTSCSTAACRR